MDDSVVRRLLRRMRATFSLRSEFARNVAKVSAGQLAAAALTALSFPVVARLYAPEHFGSLQLLLSVAATCSVLAALKYETAIVLPAAAEVSDRVTMLCLLALAATTLGMMAGVASFGDPVLGFLGAGSLVPFATLVVVAFAWLGLARILRHLLIARGRYGALSRNNVIVVACTQVAAIAYGLVRPEFLGLFVGQLVGQAVGIGLALRVAPLRLAGQTGAALWAVAVRFRKFPLVNGPGALLNSLSHELPVFLLMRFFGSEVVGFYMVASRLLNQPMVLLGQSVSQVYLGAAAQARHRGAAELRRLCRAAQGRLAWLGLGPTVLVLALAPPLAELVLGPPWREAGVYMQILVLASYAAFVTAPVASTFSILDRQETGVTLMALSAVARLVAMLWFRASPHAMLLALSVVAVFSALLTNLVLHRVLARETGA